MKRIAFFIALASSSLLPIMHLWVMKGAAETADFLGMFYLS